jgi:hypothetical protein
MVVNLGELCKKHLTMDDAGWTFLPLALASEKKLNVVVVSLAYPKTKEGKVRCHKEEQQKSTQQTLNIPSPLSLGNQTVKDMNLVTCGCINLELWQLVSNTPYGVLWSFDESWRFIRSS